MLRELLHEITGFSPENFTIRDTVAEFNAKFSSCFLKINGKVLYVREITFIDDNPDALLLRTQGSNKTNYTNEEIFELLPVKPKVGSYFTTDGFLVTFSKTARRQYRKSLCLGENYHMHVYSLKTKKVFQDYENTKLLQNMTDNRNISGIGYISKNRQFVFTQGDILFFNQKIGVYTQPTASSIFYKTFPIWEQEIHDVIHYELEG